MPLRAPRHDLRPGAVSASLFRLCVVVLLCALQYWLLTQAMESWKAGDHESEWPAFLASLTCFALSASLVFAGERGARNAERAVELNGGPHARKR
ncbi:MAG: hypothetical protein JST92_19490 [Deltaproteobacteria bacterium]|nr:hypothetical protein [Deltaproteobacteria bacterium]